MINKKNPLILYHGNCYDGFGAAWAAWKKFGKDAEYRPCFYGMEPPNDWWERNCYVLDFSFPAKVISNRVLGDQSLMLNLTDFKVLDHHRTAQEDLKEQPGYCVFDMDKSGAVLAWEFFHPGKPVPLLTKYLQDRDLWKFELPESRYIDCWVKSHKFDFALWEEMALDIEHDWYRVLYSGKGAYDYQKNMVEVMCDNAWMTDLCGYKIPVTNATVFFSEVGEELCKRFPEVPFAAYYLDRKDGKRQWGLRSRNGFDVSEVAKKLGGGGHAAASGFVENIP